MASPPTGASRCAAASTLVLFLLVFLSTSPVATVVLVTVMGVTGFTAAPVLGALVMRFAGSAPTLASALGSSAADVGIAVGSAHDQVTGLPL
ncbi:hypothetical protein ACWGA9_11985 [Streptomyces sp. NPDC054950]|nr:hypothetical protein OV320_5820 [Actinobacteria bacterium OV320]